MTPILLAIHPLATINALLNTGWVFIRRGNWRAHRGAMVAAFVVSTVFLACYLAYHWIVGHVPFAGQGPVRLVYFAILISHIVLAAAVPVLAIAMFALILRGRLDAHRRLGRVALPIWLYVSVTGVVIYLLLYHVYPQPAAIAFESRGAAMTSTLWNSWRTVGSGGCHGLEPAALPAVEGGEKIEG